MNRPVKIDLTDATTFPSRRVETWKYSDLARYLREAPAASPEAALEGEGPFAALNAEPMAFVNGKAGSAADRIVSGEQVLALRFVSRAEGTGHAASAHIVAHSGANLVLLESHEGQGAAYVAHNRLELDIAADATVTRIVLVEDAADAISIVEADVNLAAGGRFRQTVLTTGAKLQRVETRLAHSANGADARLDGLYLLTGSRHADLTTVVDHLDADGTTSQLTKGVARETARGVFQGKIIVERGADGTDARMAHNALIDGERAEIDAKPELIIYADDVQCAHGNTVGTLDETALFYMQARGITAEEARALLTEAFLNEVVDRIEQEDVREVVGQWLTERL